MYIPNRLLNDGEYWVIRHKPSDKLLCANPTGKGHTRMDIEDTSGVPRIFYSELSAKLALSKWLEGCFCFNWEDGMEIYNPKTPRVREDMEVVKIALYELFPEKDPL